MNTILKAVLALVTAAVNLAQSFMIWALNYFSNSSFMMKASDITSSSSMIKELFSGESSGTNVLVKLQSSIILPASIALVIILLSMALYSSILSERETESPGNLFKRLVITMALIAFGGSIMAFGTDAAGVVEDMIDRRISGATTQITTAHFMNLQEKVEQVFNGSGSGSGEYEDAENTRSLFVNVVSDIAGDLGFSFDTYDVYNFDDDTLPYANRKCDELGIDLGTKIDEKLGSSLYANREWADLAGGDGKLREEDYHEAESILETHQEAEQDETIQKIGVGAVTAVAAVILAWAYMKLVVQYLSRYVRLFMVIYFTPLAASTYASPSTEDIWKAFVRMFGGSLVSVVISRALLRIMRFAVITTMNAGELNTIIIYYCMTLGYVRFAESIDDYLNKAKLNVAGETRPSMMNAFGTEIMKGVGRMVTAPFSSAARATGHVIGAATSAPLKLATAPIKGAANKASGAAKNAAKSAAASAYAGAKNKLGGIDNKIGQFSALKNMVPGMPATGFSNISTKDRGAIKKAQGAIMGAATPNVTGFGKDGEMFNMAKGDKGFRVGQTMGSVDGQGYRGISRAIDAYEKNPEAGKVTGAKMDGMDGHVYSVSRDGAGKFSAKDDNGQSLDMKGVDNWGTAAAYVSSAAGGLSGNSELYSDSGERFFTQANDDGGLSVSKFLGDYSDANDAVSRMSSFGADSFAVTNSLGYDSGSEVSAKDVGAHMTAATSTGVSMELGNGTVSTGTMYSDGHVTLTDTNGKEQTYSDLESAISAGKGTSVSFYGNAAAYGDYVNEGYLDGSIARRESYRKRTMH